MSLFLKLGLLLMICQMGTWGLKREGGKIPCQFMYCPRLLLQCLESRVDTLDTGKYFLMLAFCSSVLFPSWCLLLPGTIWTCDVGGVSRLRCHFYWEDSKVAV